jgi:hypothetical protein
LCIANFATTSTHQNNVLMTDLKRRYCKLCEEKIVVNIKIMSCAFTFNKNVQYILVRQIIYILLDESLLNVMNNVKHRRVQRTLYIKTEKKRISLYELQ